MDKKVHITSNGVKLFLCEIPYEIYDLSNPCEGCYFQIHNIDCNFVKCEENFILKDIKSIRKEKLQKILK